MTDLCQWILRVVNRAIAEGTGPDPMLAQGFRIAIAEITGVSFDSAATKTEDKPVVTASLEPPASEPVQERATTWRPLVKRGQRKWDWDAIRVRYETSGLSQTDVAREFGTTQTQISRRVVRDGWAKTESRGSNNKHGANGRTGVKLKISHPRPSAVMDALLDPPITPEMRDASEIIDSILNPKEPTQAPTEQPKIVEPPRPVEQPKPVEEAKAEETPPIGPGPAYINGAIRAIWKDDLKEAAQLLGISLTEVDQFIDRHRNRFRELKSCVGSADVNDLIRKYHGTWTLQEVPRVPAVRPLERAS